MYPGVVDLAFAAITSVAQTGLGDMAEDTFYLGKYARCNGFQPFNRAPSFFTIFGMAGKACAA